MSSTHRPAKPLPLTVAAAGWPLPRLYRATQEQGWLSVGAWTFLRGEMFLDLHESINHGLAAAAEADLAVPHLVLPFATHEERAEVACFELLPDAVGRILLVKLSPRPHVRAALGSFEVWLRDAVDDLVRSCAPVPDWKLPAPAQQELLASGDDARSSTRRYLLRRLGESEVDMEFVAAEAGDRELSPEERLRHERVKAQRGEQIYSDMMSTLTQHRYPPRMARWLWDRVQTHRQRLCQQLDRPVAITVASLDFLTQHRHLVEGALVLCSETELTQVAEVALRDGLTGLYDQTTFRARLERELGRARRYGSALSVLLLDLDHFKQLNDQHGHLAGDRVLAQVGQFLRDQLRAQDLAARYGGEEFVALLPETGNAEAFALAERLRRLIELSFADGLGVTISVGVASCPEHGDTVEGLIMAADRAMYRAKSTGRNQTSRAGQPDPLRAEANPAGAGP